MSARKIFSIICLPLTVLLIVSLFLPFVDNGYTSYSYWGYFADEYELVSLPIFVLIALIIAVLIFVLQLCGVMKDAKFASFSIGFYLEFILFFMFMCMKHEVMKNLSIGFWLGLIGSIVLLILLIIGSCLSNKKPQRNNYYANNNNNRQPSGYDPYTGQPIYK